MTDILELAKRVIALQGNTGPRPQTWMVRHNGETLSYGLDAPGNTAAKTATRFFIRTQTGTDRVTIPFTDPKNLTAALSVTDRSFDRSALDTISDDIAKQEAVFALAKEVLDHYKDGNDAAKQKARIGREIPGTSLRYYVDDFLKDPTLVVRCKDGAMRDIEYTLDPEKKEITEAVGKKDYSLPASRTRLKQWEINTLRADFRRQRFQDLRAQFAEAEARKSEEVIPALAKLVWAYGDYILSLNTLHGTGQQSAYNNYFSHRKVYDASGRQSAAIRIITGSENREFRVVGKDASDKQIDVYLGKDGAGLMSPADAAWLKSVAGDVVYALDQYQAKQDVAPIVSQWKSNDSTDKWLIGETDHEALAIRQAFQTELKEEFLKFVQDWAGAQYDSKHGTFTSNGKPDAWREDALRHYTGALQSLVWTGDAELVKLADQFVAFAKAEAEKKTDNKTKREIKKFTDHYDAAIKSESAAPAPTAPEPKRPSIVTIGGKEHPLAYNKDAAESKSNFEDDLKEFALEAAAKKDESWNPVRKTFTTTLNDGKKTQLEYRYQYFVTKDKAGDKVFSFHVEVGDKGPKVPSLFANITVKEGVVSNIDYNHQPQLDNVHAAFLSRRFWDAVRPVVQQDLMEQKTEAPTAAPAPTAPAHKKTKEEANKALLQAAQMHLFGKPVYDKNNQLLPADTSINLTKAAIEAALKDGADINCQDSATGSTLLHYLIRENAHPDLVRYALEKNARVDIPNKSGYTPLDRIALLRVDFVHVSGNYSLYGASAEIDRTTFEPFWNFQGNPHEVRKQNLRLLLDKAQADKVNINTLQEDDYYGHNLLHVLVRNVDKIPEATFNGYSWNYPFLKILQEECKQRGMDLNLQVKDRSDRSLLDIALGVAQIQTPEALNKVTLWLLNNGVTSMNPDTQKKLQDNTDEAKLLHPDVRERLLDVIGKEAAAVKKAPPAPKTEPAKAPTASDQLIPEFRKIKELLQKAPATPKSLEEIQKLFTHDAAGNPIKHHKEGSVGAQFAFAVQKFARGDEAALATFLDMPSQKDLVTYLHETGILGTLQQAQEAVKKPPQPTPTAPEPNKQPPQAFDVLKQQFESIKPLLALVYNDDLAFKNWYQTTYKTPGIPGPMTQVSAELALLLAPKGRYHPIDSEYHDAVRMFLKDDPSRLEAFLNGQAPEQKAVADHLNNNDITKNIFTKLKTVQNAYQRHLDQAKAAAPDPATQPAPAVEKLNDATLKLVKDVIAFANGKKWNTSTKVDDIEYGADLNSANQALFLAKQGDVILSAFANGTVYTRRGNEAWTPGGAAALNAMAGAIASDFADKKKNPAYDLMPPPKPQPAATPGGATFDVKPLDDKGVANSWESAVLYQAALEGLNPKGEPKNVDDKRKRTHLQFNTLAHDDEALKKSIKAKLKPELRNALVADIKGWNNAATEKPAVYAGIGITLTPDDKGQMVVTDVMNMNQLGGLTPAATQLWKGDIVVSVSQDGKDWGEALKNDTKKAAEQIRGVPGSEVWLKVLRGSAEISVGPLKRDLINGEKRCVHDFVAASGKQPGPSPRLRYNPPADSAPFGI